MRDLKQMPDLAGLLAGLLLGLVFFALTDPRRMPPAVLMVGFAIILAVLYCGLRLIGRTTGLQERLRPGQYQGLLFVGTVLPVLLLGLQSLGQLTPRDVVALVLVFAIGYFYISRLSART